MSEVVAGSVPGLDALVWFAIISFAAAIVVSGAWAVQSFFLRCKASKLIDAASRSNFTLGLFFKSNHVTKIVPCKVHANGYLETMSKSKKEPKHFVPILRTCFTKKEVELDSSDPAYEAEKNASVKESQEIAQVESQILTPTAVEGTNCRAYLIYSGVACAVTPEALVALGVTAQNFTAMVGDENAKLSLDVGLNVNPQLVKKYLTKLYDQSTVDGYGQDRYQEGWAERSKNGQDNAKLAILLGIGLCIVGAAMLCIAAFT